jgi:PAS domain S-box-containing protein
LLTASPAVIYSLKYVDGMIQAEFVSENITRFLGYTAKEADFAWWSSNVHPDDRERCLRRLGELQERGHIVQEYRFRHKDGSYIWLREEQRGVRDENGHVIGVVGAWMDITNKKHLEQELATAHEETVLVLAAAAEAHDHLTGQHVHRIRSLAEAIAEEMGYDPTAARQLGLAAVLHDVGKIRVPRAILGKEGDLTEQEWDVMRKHTVWGSDLLADYPRLNFAAMIALNHHQRWDGTGYPNGLAGNAIPEPATIVAVADAFDAMTNDRPNHTHCTREEALEELRTMSGRQFNPAVVRAMLAVERRRQSTERAPLSDAPLVFDTVLPVATRAERQLVAVR